MKTHMRLLLLFLTCHDPDEGMAVLLGEQRDHLDNARGNVGHVRCHSGIYQIIVFIPKAQVWRFIPEYFQVQVLHVNQNLLFMSQVVLEAKQLVRWLF